MQSPGRAILFADGLFSHDALLVTWSNNDHLTDLGHGGSRQFTSAKAILPLFFLSHNVAQEGHYLFPADDIPHVITHHIAKHLVGAGAPP